MAFRAVVAPLALAIAAAALRRRIPVPTPTCWSALVRQRSPSSVVALPEAVSSPPSPSRRRSFPPHANCGLGSSEQSPQILPSLARLGGGSVRRAGLGAASRRPAQANASGGVEGRGALPRATDEQLVGVGQGACALSSRREGIRCGAGFGPAGGRRRATAVHAACGAGLDCRLGAGHGEERT